MTSAGLVFGGSRRAGSRQTRASTQEENMEKDVVCGMQVEPAQAAASSQHQGKTYYFCSTACKAKFEAKPDQFAK
jgi:YHS domain-containing protein